MDTRALFFFSETLNHQKQFLNKKVEFKLKDLGSLAPYLRQKVVEKANKIKPVVPLMYSRFL